MASDDPLILPESWRAPLLAEVDRVTLASLSAFLAAEDAAGRTLYPPAHQRFAALEMTPPDTVRVVILGQDPYHGPGQAHGLSFSVGPGVRTPPSLANIYKELEADLGIPRAQHGNLSHWARQGVLLLNTVLTVEGGKAASHQKRGWEAVTDAVIRTVNHASGPVVFLLWGRHAQKKAALVSDTTGGGPHLVLTAAHPSPLSAHNGFLGCRHFSQANAFLQANGCPPIDWQLPDDI